MRFTDKIAIVSGASSGIGLATAKRLGSEGARVILVGRNAEKLRAAAGEVRQVGAPEALDVPCDVSKEADVETAVQRALALGGLDIIVNNAGLMIFKPLEEQTTDDWFRVLNVDLMGAFYFIRQAFHHMRRGGNIVNISSVHAVETTPLVSAYAAAKAALLSLTRSASMEGAARGIRVNAVLPGAVDTPMLWENPNVKSGLEKIDRGMMGTPEEVANVIAFLASSESSFVRGASITADGGRLGKL
jgi:meso-butanediol dehydrogenase/(S,S)-butanediol dehydrogenase/diacetyl reductase